MNKRQSGLGPVLGESLQSFIFRVLYRNGYCDFSTVLTNGGWGARPSVPFIARKEFEVFSSCDLLRVFEASTVYDQRYSIFNSHFEYLFSSEKDHVRYNKLKPAKFRDVFFPIKEKHYAGKPMIVKYCADCIRLQIEQNGFAFFKAAWKYQLRCGTHSKPLHGFGWGLSLLNVADVITQVLKGEQPSCSCELTECDFETDNNVDYLSRLIKLAPCAIAEIIEHFVTTCKFYPEGYLNLVDYGFFNNLSRITFLKWQLREALKSRIEEFYEAAMEQDYDSTMAFLHDEMKLIRVRYVDEVIQSDARWLLKSKAIDCGECAVTHNVGIEKCSASQLVFFQRKSLFSLSTPSPFKDMCDQKLRELRFQLIQHQDEQGVEAGEHAVNYQLQRAKLIKQTGGINAMQEFRKSRRAAPK